MELQIGMTFEVVEWIGSDFGRYCGDYIGCQGVVDPTDDDFMFANTRNGLICISPKEIKPVGRLTITKLK